MTDTDTEPTTTVTEYVPGAPVPLVVALRTLAKAPPDPPAIPCGDRSATRGEVEARANRLARAYAAIGVSEGDRVTIALPNGIDYYAATIATWKLGAVPNPVSPR